MGIFPKSILYWLVAIIISVLPLAAIAEINLLSNDRLIEATKADDQTGAEALLARGHNVNVRDENRRTSLFFAAIQGNEDFVELLLRFNPRVNTVDKLGSSPLYYAAAGNYVGVIEMLAEKDANLNAQNRQGLTPLMVAASEGHLAAVQALLDLKADSTLTDFTGRTAFDWALRNNRQAVVRFLKTAGSGS